MNANKRHPNSDDFWYDRRMDGSLNRWFASYEEAVASRSELGGYLLPFRSQFVVCEEAAIRALGLDPADPDWEAIGYNIAHPSDDVAFQRLKKKRDAVRMSDQ